MKKSEQRLKVERLRRKAMLTAFARKVDGLSDNEVAEKVRRSGDPLLISPEWKALRYAADATSVSATTTRITGESPCRSFDDLP